ncbi:MAG TPA: MmgE/PrpD family protein [Xanthobacteraceae bacterium]
MDQGNVKQSIDRRLFLGASVMGASILGTGASTLLGVPALAQQGPADSKQVDVKPSAGINAKRLSEVIAEFVTGFDLKTVPPELIDRARVGITDTVGVMLAGSRQEVSAILCDMVRHEGSAPSASIVGQSLRASPQLAALANGVAAHAMDYDFTYVAGQAASAVLPAVLPLAETTGASPAETMAAFIIGCEVAARVGRSNFLASSVGGWHTTGMVGVIAAAAASARLLKVPLAQIPNVIGISASLASGISVNFGTMSKPLHSGNAARNGVMAALLGGHGFTAQPNALEGHSGYFEDFGRNLTVTFEPFQDLGQRYDLLVLGYDLKAYPCGGLAHTSIEAALALRERLASRLSEITSIHCSVTRNAGQRAGLQYPQSVENAKFSLAYMVAYSFVHGIPKIGAFTEEAIRDERVKALAKTVSATVDPALGPGTRESPAILKVTLANGETFEQRVDNQTGSIQKPMTQAQIEGKFLDCAAQSVDADVARKILAVLNALPGRPSLDDFWPLVRLS